MEVIQIEVSSISNIDFTSCIMQYIDNPKIEINIYLKRNVVVPTDPIKRNFVSRLAIPILDWEYCINDVNEKNDRSWRQKHIPLEYFSVYSSMDFINLFFKRLNSNSNFSDEKKRLIEIHDLLLNSQNSDILENFKSVINHIFVETVNYKPNVEFAENIKNNPSYKIGFFKFIKSFLRTQTNNELILSKGGAIEMENLQNESEKKIYKHFSLINDDLILIDTNNISIIWDDIFAKNFKITFIGLSEAIFFEQIGKVAHLPYYFEANYLRGNHKDYISPISATSKERISIANGGNGFRHNPTGSLLFDYIPNMTVKILNLIFKVTDINRENLFDWIYITNNYPKSNQKLAENQNTLRQYLIKRVKDICFNQKEIKIDFLNKTTEMPIPLLGYHLLDLRALIEIFKNSCNSFKTKRIDSALEIELLDKGILTSNQVLNFDKFNTKIFSLVEDIKMLLINSGFPSNFLFEHIKKIEELSKQNNTLLKLDSTSYLELNQVFNKKLISAIDEVIFEYYSLVIFIFSVILKGHILNNFIFNGGNNFKTSINSILENREKKYFSYEPMYNKIC